MTLTTTPPATTGRPALSLASGLLTVLIGIGIGYTAGELTTPTDSGPRTAVVLTATADA